MLLLLLLLLGLLRGDWGFVEERERGRREEEMRFWDKRGRGFCKETRENHGN